MTRTEDTPTSERAGFRDALERLRAAQKPGRGAPPYSRWINRRMGRVIAAAAHSIGATPDQVTAASAVLTASGIALIALVQPDWWLGIAVAALLVLGYAFDAADGQLARLRGGGSRAGEWLDHMVDVTKTCVLHIAVLVSFVRFETVAPDALLLIPLGYLTVSTVFFFGIMLVDQLRRSAPVAPPRAGGGSGWFQTLVALPADYGILCLVFVTFGAPPVFLVAYTLMFAGHTVVLLAALVRWRRQLRAIDDAARTATGDARG